MFTIYRSPSLSVRQFGLFGGERLNFSVSILVNSLFYVFVSRHRRANRSFAVTKRVAVFGRCSQSVERRKKWRGNGAEAKEEAEFNEARRAQ